MLPEVSCYTCYRPIEMGGVLSHGELHCSFECAAETGRRLWGSGQMMVSGTATIGVKEIASKVPAPPIGAKRASRSPIPPG